MEYCICIDTFKGCIFVELKRFANADDQFTNLCVCAEICPEKSELGRCTISYEQLHRTAIDIPITAQQFNYLFRCVKYTTDFAKEAAPDIAQPFIDEAAKQLFLLGCYENQRQHNPDTLHTAVEQLLEF